MVLDPVLRRTAASGSAAVRRRRSGWHAPRLFGSSVRRKASRLCTAATVAINRKRVAIGSTAGWREGASWCRHTRRVVHGVASTLDGPSSAIAAAAAAASAKHNAAAVSTKSADRSRCRRRCNIVRSCILLIPPRIDGWSADVLFGASTMRWLAGQMQQRQAAAAVVTTRRVSV